MSELQATNPQQYDSPELDWSISGAEDSASRVYFREGLDSVIPSMHFLNKKVLDIGSGVGQLFNWLKDKGASTVTGFDPSERNVETSKKKYPWAMVHKSTLHEFASHTSEKFAAATAVMVFEHIQDLTEAFKDIHSLLDSQGEFFLIIGDKNYHLLTDKAIRGKMFVSVEVLQTLGGGAIETKTIRFDGMEKKTVMYDIFRPLEEVLRVAKEIGFEVFVEESLLGPFSIPIDERTHTICHLLGFKKTK